MPGSPGSRSERLKKLKRDIAQNRYEVGAEEIAEAILRKAELLKRARGALDGSAAGRIQQAGGERRNGH